MSSTMRSSIAPGRRIVASIALLVASLVVPASVAAEPSGTVDVQLLAINDFHGNLQPPSGSGGVIGTTPAGGVEYLATHIKNLSLIHI